MVMDFWFRLLWTEWRIPIIANEMNDAYELLLIDYY